ncbi:MAG TPA: ABC transporter ATP-binding protein [Stellaceae bacterium]|nr:ABC transporter ATP-binding protein [Stellaceae bacterium]
MIELDGVVRVYGGRRVVDGVSLVVPTGALCALVGSSGAGKSTTLRMINRLVPMSAGAIRIDGTDVTTVPVEALRRRIGYVIQSIGLFPHWTVAENIATVPRLLGWPRERIAARTDALLALLRLDPDSYRDRYAHQLSGGQQQRVGVARALAADPEILLMDEPFGALDPITRDALGAELALIHRETRKTIVFVTHDMDMALKIADIVAIMHEGRIVQQGAPLDILERPADDFVREFVGRAAIGLKLLALRHVGESMRPGLAAAGEPVDEAAPLSEALSQMVMRRTDRIPVRDAEGAVTGSVVLADLVRRA